MPGGVVGGLRQLRARVGAWRGGGSAHAVAASAVEPARVPAPRTQVERAAEPAPPSAARSAHDAPKARLEVTGLTKRFGGVTAVDNVDLVLHDAQILAVIGPNGAGKSTMINLLSGVLPSTSGRIVFDGKDVTRAPAYQIAGMGLARTFQTPVMFEGMTVLETVLVGTYTVGHAGILRAALPTPGALGEERRLRQIAEHALRRCGLAHLRDREATKLSLGHQKIVEIARGLASQPSVLLLDEPAAGLNRAEKQELSRLLRGLRGEGIALILVEHDMELVMGLADRVHVLVFGKTVRVGTPAEVRADPEVIRAYLGVDDQAEEGVNVGH
jgi:ABC-type branched-subunit amino acid transport system ATPase component